ncbi:ATP-binding protein [Alteromonas sp. ASW11-36]|uniref:histidine kinase n=1 Tax=Alteromonas arenosi TaxID=3055817 RepID=A0ABT7SX47_9ALTE|nr:ATP-binding protein [Alteromonas sp. ASW11-36]MDM7860129.1 ATP-binding protein [Alteromonas sp. ASW11-36]
MLYNQAQVEHDFEDLNSGSNRTAVMDNSSEMIEQESYLSLKRQSQRLERLLQVMPAGVIVIDGKGVVRQANRLARQLLGEPLEAEIWRDIIARSFKPRADDGHEVSLRDGRRVKLSITPLIEEPGQLIVITDLTETRQLQARVSHMQRLSSLGKMVASLAHQIRTPLSAALLYAANLAQDKMNPGLTNKFASKLLDRLHELESQVNDMLLFAKSGDQNIIAPTSIVEIIHQVESSCSSLLAQSNTHVQVTIDKAARSAVLQANATALQGALVNLVQNAVQASEPGTTVSIAVSVDVHNKELIISCRDQGKGLPTTKAATLFEPFYTTKTNGTGLGLAVVNQAVRAHKGRIKASNHKLGGAEFTIWLPISHFSQSPQAEAELES